MLNPTRQPQELAFISPESVARDASIIVGWRMFVLVIIAGHLQLDWLEQDEGFSMRARVAMGFASLFNFVHGLYL